MARTVQFLEYSVLSVCSCGTNTEPNLCLVQTATGRFKLLGGLRSNGTETYANDKKLSLNSINRHRCLRIAGNRYKRQIFGSGFSV